MPEGLVHWNTEIGSVLSIQGGHAAALQMLSIPPGIDAPCIASRLECPSPPISIFQWTSPGSQDTSTKELLCSYAIDSRFPESIGESSSVP